VDGKRIEENLLRTAEKGTRVRVVVRVA